MARIFDTTYVIQDVVTGEFWSRNCKTTKNLKKAWQYPVKSAAQDTINATFKLKTNRDMHRVVAVKHELSLA